MNDEFFALLRDDVKDGFQGVHDRLDMLNGRVRMAEQDVAVLKDRADQTQKAAQTSGLKSGLGAAALLTAVAEALKAYFK